MADGYLYKKFMKLLEQLTKEGNDSRLFYDELPRRFRLTKKDVFNVLKEIEREKKNIKITKRRIVFVVGKNGFISLGRLFLRVVR